MYVLHRSKIPSYLPPCNTPLITSLHPYKLYKPFHPYKPFLLYGTLNLSCFIIVEVFQLLTQVVTKQAQSPA